MTKPSELLRQELKKMLKSPGALNAFCIKNGFKFNSVYKIATNSIEQPGLDYGLNLLTALKSDNELELLICSSKTNLNEESGILHG